MSAKERIQPLHMKAAAINNLVLAAKEYATYAGHPVTITFTNRNKPYLLLIDGQTNVLNAVQRWASYSSGQQLPTQLLMALPRELDITSKPIAQHMVEAINTYNQLSVLQKISRIDCAANTPDHYGLEAEGGINAEQADGFARYCFQAMITGRDARINELYATMDAHLEELALIKSGEFMSEGKFEGIIRMLDGLRGLEQRESRLKNAGILAVKGHVGQGLLAYAHVVEEAVALMPDSPSTLAQKSVLRAIHDAFNKGKIPTSNALSRAWQEGEHAAKTAMQQLDKDFQSRLGAVRQEPKDLFAMVKDIAKQAHNNQLTSEQAASRYEALSYAVSELLLQAPLTKEEGEATQQFKQSLKSLREALKSQSTHLHALVTNAAKLAESNYEQALSRTLHRIEQRYEALLAEGERGLMRWVADEADVLAQRHPMYAMTQTPTMYHNALRHFFEHREFNKDISTNHEPPSTRYLIDELQNIRNYFLSKGEQSQAIESAAVDKIAYYDHLRSHMLLQESYAESFSGKPETVVRAPLQHGVGLSATGILPTATQTGLHTAQLMAQTPGGGAQRS